MVTTGRWPVKKEGAITKTAMTLRYLWKAVVAGLLGASLALAQDVGAQSRPLEQEGRSTPPNSFNPKQRVFGIADEKQQALEAVSNTGSLR